jgi:hypothetical protein
MPWTSTATEVVGGPAAVISASVNHPAFRPDAVRSEAHTGTGLFIPPLKLYIDLALE